MTEDINDKDKLIGSEEKKVGGEEKKDGDVKADMMKEGKAAIKDPKAALENGKSKLADFLDDGKINNSNKEGKSLGEIAKDKITALGGGPEEEEAKDGDGDVIKKAKKEKSMIVKGLDKIADYLDDGKMNNSNKGKDSAAAIGSLMQEGIDGETVDADGNAIKDGGPVKKWAAKHRMASRQAATEILVGCIVLGGFGFFYGIYKNPKKAVPFGIVGSICVLLNIVGWPIAIAFAYHLFKPPQSNRRLAKASKKKNKVGGIF